MNKHFTNKNLLRGITGLAITGLAGAALSAGSVAASGTEICWETGANGLPRIVECPPEFSFPLPGFTPILPEVNLDNDIDYGALLDYLGNTDDNDDNDEAGEADSGDTGFGGIELPTPIDPEVFQRTVPEIVNPEQFEIDPDTIIPLPDFPDVEPEAEVAPEPQPEVQPEVAPEPQPEVQPEVRVNNSEVAPEELPATPDTVTPEVETPEVVAPEAVTPEIIVPDTDADTDINFNADVDRTADLDDADLVEAAPVEVFTTDDTTEGANLGLYAGILLILGGGGSLAAIAATRRNRD